jgi:hypothetical protein
LPSIVRVLAATDGTALTFDPPSVHAPVTLAAGGVLEFAATGSFMINGGAPVLVATFMLSAARGGQSADPEGDPSLVFEIPVEQYHAFSAFLAPSTYLHNFANIVGPSGSAPILDGSLVTVPEQRIGASGLSLWATPLGPGPHHVGGPGRPPFGVKVYGAAPGTSYASPGGFDLQRINGPG